MGSRSDWLQGIFPALVTPFTTTGELDEGAFRQLIRRLLPQVDGLVPCGTTGEAPYLGMSERQRLISICLEETAGRVPVLAGTGCASTRDTVEMTRWAQQAGVSAALVVSPYYLKPDFNEIYAHFQAVDAIGLPFVIYNMPQCTGIHCEWWTAEGALQDLSHAIGIKDSSGDMSFVATLLEKLRGQVSIMIGHDEIVQAALAAGADGAILASANLVPGHWRAVRQAVMSQDLDTARRGQRELQTLARLIARRGASQACKEGLHMQGLETGPCRLPTIPGDQFRREDREELRLQLEALGCIPRRPIVFETRRSKVTSTVFAIPETPALVRDFTLKVGEGFAGPPLQELAHVDLLLGERDGPVGQAIEKALQAPDGRRGLGILTRKPQTLLVPTVTLRNDAQQQLFERAGRGIARAIADSIDDGFLPAALLDELAIIVNAFVHSAAAIGRRVEFNNYKAARHALRKAIEGRPSVAELIREKDAARHPLRYAP